MKLIKIDQKEAIKILEPYGVITQNIIGSINNYKDPKGVCYSDENKENIVVGFHNEQMDHYRVCVYGHNQDFFDAVMEKYGDKVVVFPALAKNVFEGLFKNKKPSWSDECHLVYYDKDSVEVPSMEGLTLGSLDLSLAELVNDRYTYKDEHSLEKIKEEIQNRETVCGFMDGRPVCWILTHIDDSMGAFYTEKEYRGRGIGVVIQMEMMRRILKNHKIPFGHIVLGNEASIHVSNKTGMSFYKDNIVWAGIENPDGENNEE